MEPRLIEAAREKTFLKSRRLQLTIPSVLGRGEPFELRITAFGPDAMPSGDFGREIIFAPSPGVEGLPASVTLDPAEGGHGVVEGLTATGVPTGDTPAADGPDWCCVAAKVEGSPVEIRSNPAWVFDDPPYRVYWGDIHVHTVHSNCMAWACFDPEFALAYARDATHLDFCAAADHLRGIAWEGGRWERQQELVAEYDEPGRFVPFLAFESSHKRGFGGDNNAYFLGWDAPHFWLDREDMKGNAPEVTLRELWNFLDAAGESYFTVPHHTGRAGKYRRFNPEGPLCGTSGPGHTPVYDAEREPLFEIYSAWGSSEARATAFPLHAGNTDEPAYFVDAIRAGCRYGVIASSDDHATLPGSDWKCNWAPPLGPKGLSGYIHHGLAAARAKELTREAIWDGLVGKRTYATTFERALLDMRIGDVGMGQSAEIDAGDPLFRKREVRALVTASHSNGGNAVLVRNGDEIAREKWSGRRQSITFVDEAPLDEVAVRDAPFHPEPFVAYYVRIEGASGQTLWSSPIWLDVG